MLEARANQEESRKESEEEPRRKSQTKPERSPKDPQPCTSAGNEEKGGLRHREPPRLGRAERAQITEAFRRYAANGETAPRISEVDPRNIPCEVFVSQTLSVLRAMEKPWIIEAVKAVYFVRPTEPLHKSDIDSRITKFCITHYVSRSTVYGWLSRARRIYWAIATAHIYD